jgi:hypothetical protein
VRVLYFLKLLGEPNGLGIVTPALPRDETTELESRSGRAASSPPLHIPGDNLAVMLADGGDCLADLRAVRDQADLFGEVASDSTAFRVIDKVDLDAP